ncbi:MAG: AAA family ATPase [Tannerellaceae bacterium]|nr:AAA family ATPase [Tannerellaceae bacterium]
MIYINRIINTHEPSGDDTYPYTIPSIRNLRTLEFRKPVTFLVGDNGSGKSSLIEAIAINSGFNPEGGGRNFNFTTYDTHSDLYKEIRLVRSPVRNPDGYFMRAETFYNLATEIDTIEQGIHTSYGFERLHEKSHGESFMNVFLYRFHGNGLYIFDEPEAALFVKSIFALLTQMRQLERLHSQFIIATHSPILLAYPGADIYTISEDGIELTTYEETAPYQLTKYFLNNYQRVLKDLFEGLEDE